MATHRETHMPFGGVVVDVQQARNVAEVIDLVPEFGKEVVGVPVYTLKDPNSTNMRYTPEVLTPLDNYKAPTIDGRPLGAVVGANFGFVQPRADLEVAQYLVDNIGAEWRSVALYKDSLRILVEVALPQAAFSITRHDGREDTIDPRITIMDANDGTHSRWLGLLMQQLFCMNQLPGLFAEGRMRAFKHSSKVMERQGDAKLFLVDAIDRVAKERGVLQGLEDTPMGSEAFVTFVSQLLTGEDDSQTALKAVQDMEAGNAKTILLRKVDTIATLFHHGTGNCGRTAFDALSAVTEWRTKGGSVNEDAELLARVKARVLGDNLDHEVTEAIYASKVVLTDSERRRTERRLQSNLDGTSAKLVQRAARLLTSTTAIAA